MELDKSFGTYRTFRLELQLHADAHKVRVRSSSAAVATELGLVERDDLGRWHKLVDTSEVSDCYRETWWAELEGHPVKLMRDEGDQYFIYAEAPGLAQRWQLNLVDPRDPYTAIGMVPKAAVTSVRCRRGSFTI